MGDVVYTECAAVETLKHDSLHLWSNFCIGVGRRQHQGGGRRGLVSHDWTYSQKGQLGDGEF